MDKDDLRRVKVEFIRQCGHERGVAKNRKINGGGKSSSGDIKVTVKTFQFSNRNGGEKLIPEEEERFGY